MWARILELMLAAWLLFSHFLFSYEGLSPFLYGSDFGAPLCIALFAALSFYEPLNKMHLAQVIPAAWLFYVSYSYPTPFLPFALQNAIIAALFLLMFAVIPSHASEHPRPWAEFLKGKKDEKI